MMGRLQGADVSIWNGAIDARKAKAGGMQFLSAKASQGRNLIDRYWVQHVEQCRAVGLPCMPYLFVWPWVDADAQWEKFMEAIRRVGGWEGLLVPALDVEGDQNCSTQGDPDYVGHASKLLDYIAAELHGKKGVVYTFPSFNSEHGVGAALGDKSYLWEASYTRNPIAFAGWDHVTFWQYADNGSWPGIGGGLDMDFFEGTAAELQTLMALGTGAAPVVDLKVVGPTGQVIDCAPAWYDANRITAAFAPLLACTDIPHTDLPAQLFHQDTGRCFLGDARTWMEPRGWGLYYRQYADGRQLVYCQRVKAA